MSRSSPKTAPTSLGALAAGFGLTLMSPTWAQTANEVPLNPLESNLPEVIVTAKANRTPASKQNYQAVTTTIGKGKQALRDIPQSITVVTEKLMDDRNLDTVKDALKNTAGITFMAAEGGEEDVRLRGFSLQGTGDIFVDGMRDPAFYERDTFNLDRLEVLRGSASMLFGRGSTGGAVNQVSKAPFLMNSHEVSTTLGSHNYARVTGDFNFKIAEDAALRINAMANESDNNGAGSSLDKRGLAAAVRWGIGTGHEFLVSLYHLDNSNGMNYGLPWIKPTASNTAASNGLMPGLDPSAYYGLASDYNHGSANLVTASHTHRFSPTSELKTSIRQGNYTRDQRASAIRLCTADTTRGTNLDCPSTTPALDTISPSTVLTRGNNNKIQNMDILLVQSDFNSKFSTWGRQHNLLSGADYAQEQKGVLNLLGTVSKPRTTVGTPDDGASINETSRIKALASDYESKAWGVYAQDLLQVAENWKVLAGLRFDRMKGAYETFDTSTGASTGTFDQSISKWSRRFGALYQPTTTHSFHLSYGTSFNTSGDTYSYAGNTPEAREKASNTAPESSENIELGAKIDSANGNFSTRLALFHAVKKNERNTDQTSVSGDSFLLSGKRHSNGFEIDVVGRITPQWEVYSSYTWIPDAKVDQSASTTFGNRAGDRPGLIPVHSGTVWSTYQLVPAWRVGAGLNIRSSQSPADTNPQNGVWKAPGFHTIDLMTEYTINQQFTLKANLSNVENTLYADSLYRGHYIPGPGRNVQVELIAKF